MDYSAVPFNAQQEQLVEILTKKTQNDDRVFFRIMVSYYFCKMASMMRTNVKIAETQIIPINMYAMNLAPSGSGKGHSMNIIEDDIIGQFKHSFLDSTFPQIAGQNLARLAIKRARISGDKEEVEMERALLEFDEMGALLFAFDSATSAAIKQMRLKLLMAGAGSMNLEIDEIGSNLLGNNDALTTFLELFDVGKIKQKLIKNTRENIRSEDIFGSTPTNMLLFGTPTKLLDGGKTEEEFYDFLEVGYARRCFFGYCRKRKIDNTQTAQDIYNIYNDPGTSAYLANLNAQFKQLADATQFEQTISMPKDVSLALFDYRLHCQRLGDSMTEFEETKKAELTHRYFKAAKLAAAYAFVEKSVNVTMGHLENAIAMAEMSGMAFQKILSRDRAHVKLANYLAMCGKEVTHADILEDLPCYKGTAAAKDEMLRYAQAYGYKNGIVIKREQIDGIEFLSGTSIPTTDMAKCLVAVSTTDITTGYTTHEQPFHKLGKMFTTPGVNWLTHSVRDGYRDETHIEPGFNLIVLDVENSVSVDTAKMLLKEYAFCLYTTKRHTADDHRYRIIMPLSHKLSLDGMDFKEFMGNIFDWLPFSVDRQTGQRARKWLSNKGNLCYNDGETLEALQFIPKTKKAEDRKIEMTKLINLSGLERWFVQNTVPGNRNGKLIQYGYALLDMGKPLVEIHGAMVELNKKLESPLDDTEVQATVIPSITKRFQDRQGAKTNVYKP